MDLLQRVQKLHYEQLTKYIKQRDPRIFKLLNTQGVQILHLKRFKPLLFKETYYTYHVKLDWKK